MKPHPIVAIYLYNQRPQEHPGDKQLPYKALTALACSSKGDTTAGGNSLCLCLTYS